VADAHTYGPIALAGMLETAQSAGADVLLVMPERALRDGLGRFDFASATQAFEPPLPGATTTHHRASPQPWPSKEFGLVAATGVADLSAAIEEVKRQALARADQPGRDVIVAAGDASVVAALQEAGCPGAIHGRELRRLLEQRTDSRQQADLVVLGGAGVLRLVVGIDEGVRRTHVVVMPQLADWSAVGWQSCELRADVSARLAEAARPDYLTSALGTPPRDREMRVVWRETTTEIERFRADFAVTDGRRPFGSRSRSGASRELSPPELAERSRRERELTLEIAGRGLKGRSRGRELSPEGVGWEL
jgi:hypothetical protein